MKRIGNLYKKICSVDNLVLAEKRARKGKSKQYGVKLFDRHGEDNLINLHHVLTNKEYKTSNYTTFRLFEGKERIIYRLPYYPDRIVHHSIMNILEPIFVSSFTADTYSCIKKRGIHKAADNLSDALLDIEGTQYCLKLDIKKFYPNVNHDILKVLLRRKFKDNDLLHTLDEIIDSAEGLPIGNYLSQYLANFYLSGFDHWLKETLKVKYYFRYCDDLVILSSNKEDLHRILAEIKSYLETKLKLELSNHQIFPVDSRGIDFLGYVFYHGYRRLRKGIKKKFIKMIKENNNWRSIASYNGWLIHANCKNLWRKYVLTKEK